MIQEPGSDLTEKIIGIAINVHRKLGPGLLESVYNQCLSHALRKNGLSIQREVPLPLIFDGLRLDKGYMADIIVEDTVLLELKAVEHILPLHEAQTRTYLKLSRCRLALLLNFNSLMLKDGISRFALTTPRHAAQPPVPGGPRTTPTPPEAAKPAAATAA
nr:GxxExxY protein [uncultured Rhodopila sp.]